MSPFKPSLLLVSILAAYPAVAQTTPADPAAEATAKTAEAKETSAEPTQAIQSIVVTARRFGERMQDVPLSIIAMTSKDLENRGITSLTDLTQATPGLSYSTDFGRRGERPVVRGISVTRLDAPQPVSVFIDGVYVRDGVLSLGIDDAQRIEVIKGPQSALYGRATYAGAINYVTVKPGDVLTGKINTTVATDGERSIFGAMTVPLISELLSMRVGLKHSEFGGQYTNSIDGSKLGTEKSDSAGVQFFLRATPDFDASLALNSARDRDGDFVTVVRPIPLQAGGVVTDQNGSSNVANGSVCNGHTINLVGTDRATGLPSAAVPASPSTIANGWPCGAVSITGKSFPRVVTEMAHYVDPATGIDYGDVRGSNRDLDRAALTLNYQFGDGYQLTSQTAYTRALTNAGTDQSYGGTAIALGTSWISYPHWFELAPDHARYYPFYAKCVELDVPMQLQVGQSMVYDVRYPRRSVGRPISLDGVACDFPELKLIGIHVGIPWTDEMIAMAWKHANVYIGCDAHRPTYWPEAFVKYINSYGQDKVLFGTDFPVLDFERTRADIEALNLRPEPKRKLLRDNALRVYKLDGKAV